MGFVSVLELKRNRSRAKITFYKNGSCMLPKVVYGTGSSVEVEIDLDNKRLRLRIGDGLSKKFTDNGSFSVPAAAYREIITAGENKAVIELEKSEDGWWYGSYRNQEGS